MTNTEKKIKKEKKTICTRISTEAQEVFENNQIKPSWLLERVQQYLDQVQELKELRSENNRLKEQNREILRKYYSTTELLKKYTGENK